MSKPQQKQTAPTSPKEPETGTIDAQTRRLVEKSIARVNGHDHDPVCRWR